uniref:Transthyretin-like family protein n=1 Tax=Panagrolaimus superbus TaxID=310955 RepID=A0A914YNZ9_9BILA
MNYFVSAFIFGALIDFSIAGLLSRTQSTAVRGSVICGEKITGTVRLELWDKDRTDPDDLMMKPITVSYGDTFTVEGKENELTTIDPELRIIHKCGFEGAKCLKKSIILISDQYVTAGATAQKNFNAGQIDLRNIQSTDTTDCN